MASWMTGVERASWNTDGGSFTGGPPKGVLHTTEGASWPDYASGTMAPHFTVLPKRASHDFEIRQHIPLDRAARALMHLAGGVQTNRDHAIQIELIGTCDPTRKASGLYYWPEAEPWALAALATFMRRVERECGIARVGICSFLPYPQSYGNTSGQRLTLSKWDNYNGWCGHQHVPENDHGDPGSLNIKALTANATPVDPPPYRPPNTHTAPHFPLTMGHYFGPESGPAESESGYHGASARAGLRAWQARARQRPNVTCSVDGLYGEQTKAAALYIQGRARLRMDGLIGPATWASAWA